MSIMCFMNSFLLLIFSLLIFFLGPDVVLAQTSEQPPNIVLILADDLALMDFGVYGGEASTPNIDQLANRGTIFTNYHTSPSCAPSRNGSSGSFCLV